MPGVAPAEPAFCQRHQRQDAAFALVVGPEHDQDVLDRDDQDQRPQDQRQDAEDVVARRRRAGRHRRRVQRLAEGVERAGADVAVDDADRTERQREQRLSPVGVRMVARLHGRRPIGRCEVRHEGSAALVVARWGCAPCWHEWTVLAISVRRWAARFRADDAPSRDEAAPRRQAGRISTSRSLRRSVTAAPRACERRWVWAGSLSS